MAEQDPIIVSLFAKVDDLLAQGSPYKALQVLERANRTLTKKIAAMPPGEAQAVYQRARSLPFNEGFHDRMGQCYWAMAQGKPVDERGRLRNRPPRMSQLHLKLLAGQHWFLSPVEDTSRNEARALAFEDCILSPSGFFHLFRFPELPFDRFESPAVRERLEDLRHLLEVAGCDETQLRGWLDPPRSSRPPPTLGQRIVQRLACTGCAILALLAMVGFGVSVTQGVLWLLSLKK